MVLLAASCMGTPKAAEAEQLAAVLTLALALLQFLLAWA